jgi:hypothetical protein
MKTLSLDQAADVLKVSRRQVQCYVSDSLLSTDDSGRVREEDVYSWLEVRDSGMDLPQVAHMARRAFMRMQTMERTLQVLLRGFGLDGEMLSTQEDDVVELYSKVDRDLLRDTISYEEVVEWARVFCKMNEENLAFIEKYTADHEPWKKLMDLGTKLRSPGIYPATITREELRCVDGVLSLGRRNLRQAAYFYIRNIHGKRFAQTLFPDTGSIQDEVIELASMMGRRKNCGEGPYGG